MSRADSNAVVSAATPEAAAAGAAILQRGGNAVDAAVAVSLVLGVTEPAGSGIGGQSTFIVHPADGAPAFVINGTSVAPRSLPADLRADDLQGHRATTVPSCLRGLDFAWRTFGSGRLDWAELVEPSIRYALQGYPLGEFRHRALVRHAASIRRHGVATRLLLDEAGAIPAPGTSMRQSTLGRTLQRIAGSGADDFYRGEIARRIADDMADAEGWITLEDLAGLKEPAVLTPLHGTYRGWNVHTLPPRRRAGWSCSRSTFSRARRRASWRSTERCGRSGSPTRCASRIVRAGARLR